MSSIYHHGQNQLHYVHDQLLRTQNEVECKKRQIFATEQELQREREASELLHQHFMELQECHSELLKEHECSKELQEDLGQSVQTPQMFADSFASRAESIVNNVQASLAGGEVAEPQNEQSLSGITLESAKNALLVETVYSQHPEVDQFSKLKYVMSLNMELQQRNMELCKRVETLSRQA
jgi:hypothetical protein